MILLIGSKPCAKTGARFEVFEIAIVRVEQVAASFLDLLGKNCPIGNFCSSVYQRVSNEVSSGKSAFGVRKR
jgi:hypothetical protein